MTLRVIEDDSEPLSAEALQKRSNELVREMRDAALKAMRISANPGYYVSPVDESNVRDLQRVARNATAAWRRGDGLLTELQTEIDKARRGSK